MDLIITVINRDRTWNSSWVWEVSWNHCLHQPQHLYFGSFSSIFSPAWLLHSLGTFQKIGITRQLAERNYFSLQRIPLSPLATISLPVLGNRASDGSMNLGQGQNITASHTEGPRRFPMEEPGRINSWERGSILSGPASCSGSHSCEHVSNMSLSLGAALASWGEVQAPFCRGEIWRWEGSSPLVSESQLAHWDQLQNWVLFS